MIGDKVRCYIRKNCTYKLSFEQVNRINAFGYNIQYIDNNIKYLYNGELLNLLSISNKLDISIYDLYDALLKTKNDFYPEGIIDKAVRITLELKNKRKRKKFLSKIDGVDNLVKYSNLNDEQIRKLLNSNISKEHNNNYQFQYQGQNLKNFCLENHINYSVIIYAVETAARLGLDLNFAIEDALKNYSYCGQKKPIQWTYERYGVLYKHEMINLGIDYMKIINKLKKYDLSYYDAICKLSICSNNDGIKNKIEMLNNLNQQSIVRDFISSNFDDLNLNQEEVNALCKALEIYYESKIVERNHFIYSKLSDNISIEEKVNIVYNYDLSRLDLFKAYYQMLRFDDKVLYGNEEAAYKRKIDLFDLTIAWENISECDRKLIIEKYNMTVSEIEDIIKINNEIDNIMAYSFKYLK